MAAITLPEYLKLLKDPFTIGFTMDLLRQSDVLNVIPFRSVGGLQVSGRRLNALPSGSFRAIGGSYTADEASTVGIKETMSILGGDIEIDKVLVGNTDTDEDPLALNMQAKAKAVAGTFTDAFINGDKTVNVDSFEGLKVRVSNMPARMSVDLAQATDSLKVLASTGNIDLWLDGIRKAMKYSQATHVIMNENSFLGVEAALRRSGHLNTITDAHDRMWTTLLGLPIIEVGLQTDQSTEIITDTEDPGDGGNDATSFYFVNFNTVDGLHGITLAGHELAVYDPLNGAEKEGSPAYLRRVDWVAGLFNLSQYSVARLSGFKMAAS